MSRLHKERSAYLRHSADQKIDWYPWCEEAFERAKQEDKPLFLSSGAIWCHWCHVMAKECFFDDEIARILNNDFICIKIDRDEKPYIDRRYQLAVAAMGASGGWPLSVFLTPDKKPFYGGNYFPPEDRLGRPGFKKVLKTISKLYKAKREEIVEYSEKLIKTLTPIPTGHTEIDESQLDNAVKKMLSEFDSQYGGFGKAPKFPMPGILEFLMGRYFLTQDEKIGYAIRKTLESMAYGGLHDHIGGGFHRYSTDRAWVIPHFEKMADDNAWLLKNYLNAYSIFGDELYLEAVQGIINFARNVLSDPEGGFYASQDADIVPEDEGGYFTWTEEEFKRILNDEEYRILSRHFLNEAGSMHHDTSKRVLFVVMKPDEIAAQTGMEIEEVVKTIKTGKRKLKQERNKRKPPFIDKTLYTSINGMFISAFLHGFRILRDKKLRDFALKSLDRVVEKYFLNGKLLHTEGVDGILDDYVHLIDAFVAAYEVTGNNRYLIQAVELMELCINKLWDKKEGGFFDSDDHILGVKTKGIQDMPHPSTNSVGIRLLLKLYSLTGNETYHQYAEQALKTFATAANDAGIHSGYYYCTLDAYFNTLKIRLFASPDSKLHEAAIFSFNPYIDVVHEKDKGYAVACYRESCYEHLEGPKALKEYITHRKYLKIRNSTQAQVIK
jgi:hypothetical protein